MPFRGCLALQNNNISKQKRERKDVEEERKNKGDTSQNKERRCLENKEEEFSRQGENEEQGRCKNNTTEKGKPEAFGDLKTNGP